MSRVVAGKMVERSGFEPLKAIASRFTVCPVWPLRYLSTVAVARTKPTQAIWRGEIFAWFFAGGKIVRSPARIDPKTARD